MKKISIMALLFAALLGIAAGGFPRTGEAVPPGNEYWYNTVAAADLADPLHFGQRTVTDISQQGSNLVLTFAAERYIERDEQASYPDNVIVADIVTDAFYVYNINNRDYVNIPITNNTATVPASYAQNISGTSVYYLQCQARFDVTFVRDSSDLGDINWDPAYLRLPF